MGDISNGNLDVVMNVNDGATKKCDDTSIDDHVPLLQKLVAEVVGTFYLIFAGCGSVVVNLNNDKVVTLPGISIVWGLAVMVPAYIIAQVVGSTLASGALKLIFNGKENQFAGTLPAGSDLQAFVVEFIITFFLMFIISGVATDNRAIGELAGLAVGSTVILNVLFAGPITGASMNPARSLGPAIVHHEYRGIWIYVVSPILGALAGLIFLLLLVLGGDSSCIRAEPPNSQGRPWVHGPTLSSESLISQYVSSPRVLHSSKVQEARELSDYK